MAGEEQSPLERAGNGPLGGLLIADFSRVLAGPYATMLLADLGATVVKVESPLGDETRHWKPPVAQGESTYYLSINRNKRAIVLDFADGTDRELARELVRRADVLVENFRPGSLARFGLDYPAAAQLNPAIVYASITGFGSAEGAAIPGYDVLAQALAGLMSVTGEPAGEPTKAGVAVFDVMTGLHACVGILAALRHRAETGAGQHIELNLLSSALSGLVNQSGAFAAAGVVPQQLGNDHPSVYPYGPFPTGDGLLVVACGNDRQFAALCVTLDIPDVAIDDRFRTAAARNEPGTRCG